MCVNRRPEIPKTHRLEYRSVLEPVRVRDLGAPVHAHHRERGHDGEPAAHHRHPAAVLFIWRLVSARLLVGGGNLAPGRMGIAPVRLCRAMTTSYANGASADRGPLPNLWPSTPPLWREWPGSRKSANRARRNGSNWRSQPTRGRSATSAAISTSRIGSFGP